MVIKKSRINSTDKYFANIAEDKEVYVSVPADENNIDLLMMDGCSDGTCVVPQPIGPVTIAMVIVLSTDFKNTSSLKNIFM